MAAALWAGFPGRFDPSFSVRHHHGRTLADVPSLKASYDSGRGAYYAKFLLRKDTRTAYLAGWYKLMIADVSRNALRKLRREMQSASRYLRARGKSGYILIAAPLGLVTCLLLALAIPVHWALRQISGDSGLSGEV